MKIKNPLLFMLLAFVMLFSFAACAAEETETPENPSSTLAETVIEKTGLWENALYTEDKTFGDGTKTVSVKVEADGKSIVFTLKTDKAMLGDALLEHGLIEGEKSEYGLYVKKVNGILADYDVDQTYWSFTKNGEMMMAGVSSAEISDGENYELVRAK